MPKAQVIHELGVPNVMKWKEWAVPDPAQGEVRLRHTAIGVNFAGTYHRGAGHARRLTRPGRAHFLHSGN